MISSLADAKRVFGELTIKLEMNHDTQIVKAKAYDDNDIIRWDGEEYFYINTINPTENPEVEALKAEIKTLKAEIADYERVEQKIMKIVRDNDRQGIYDMLLPIHYREEDV